MKQNKHSLIQRKTTIFLAGVLIFVVGITYWKLLLGYFEQDEWVAFAMAIIYNHASTIEKIRTLFAPTGVFTHFTPVILSFVFYSFKFFGPNYLFFASYVLIMHTLNVLMLYFIILKATRSRLLAFGAGLLFAVHSVSSQAIIWIAGSLGFQTAVFFFLLSVCCYIVYLTKKNTIFLIGSVMSFILSLLCTESTLTLIVVYPLIAIPFMREKISLANIRRKISLFKNTLIFPLGVIVLALTKLLLLQINPQKHAAGFVFGTASIYPKLLLIKIFLYPLQALAQIADAKGNIFLTGSAYLSSEYPALGKQPYAIQVAQTIVPDLLYLFFGIVIVLLSVITAIILWKKRLLQIFWIYVMSLFLFFVSILPYVPLPKTIGYLENRYYYTPNLFFSVFLALTIYSWIRFLPIKNTYRKVIFLLIILLITFSNYNLVKTQLGVHVRLAITRKYILSDLRHFVPSITSSQNVFYITGSGSDYFVPGLKVPFQSGLGNILMVSYFNKKYIDPSILDDAFLYGIASEGYREKNNTGFGYYYNKSLLLEDFHKKRFKASSVRAFYWNQSTSTLTEFTDKFRKELVEQ